MVPRTGDGYGGNYNESSSPGNCDLRNDRRCAGRRHVLVSREERHADAIVGYDRDMSIAADDLADQA